MPSVCPQLSYAPPTCGRSSFQPKDLGVWELPLSHSGVPPIPGGPHSSQRTGSGLTSPLGPACWRHPQEHGSPSESGGCSHTTWALGHL